MKINGKSAKIFVLSFIAATLPSLAAGLWTPSLTSPGYHVKFFYYDVSGNPGVIELHLAESTKTLFHSFDSNNPIAISKANALLSTIMTAKTSGEGIYIYQPNSSVNEFGATALGSN
jgi:hypothetical protein